MFYHLPHHPVALPHCHTPVNRGPLEADPLFCSEARLGGHVPPQPVAGGPQAGLRAPQDGHGGPPSLYDGQYGPQGPHGSTAPLWEGWSGNDEGRERRGAGGPETSGVFREAGGAEPGGLRGGGEGEDRRRGRMMEEGG